MTEPPQTYLSIDDTRSYYLRNIARYGIDAPRTMGYHCGPIDDRLIGNMLPEKLPQSFSVLDVGCGLGQLIPILANRYPEHKITRFLGVDLVEEFIAESKLRFPQHEFESKNFLELNTLEKFDLVLAAGVLVTRISNFESYLQQFISKMISMSRGYVAFNVVAVCGPGYTAKHLATISSERLKDIISGLGSLDWEIKSKEVFPGSEDTFVTGRLM